MCALLSSSISMETQAKTNYFKLVALISDVAYLVIWRYITNNLLGIDSFETFLNKVKHELVHVYETLPCCECVVGRIHRERLISREQFLILYKSVERNKIYDHNKYTGGKLTRICICNYSANENIDIKVVDVTLAQYIIQKCGKREQEVDKWIEQIKYARNKIFHLSDKTNITNDKFSRTCANLEESILGIASLLGSKDYVAKIEKKIKETKKYIFIPSYMLKYEKLCLDYWRNKCFEFERLQIQDIENKAKLSNVSSRSMEGNCKKTVNDIQNLTTVLDNINILIRLFGKSENIEKSDATQLVREDYRRVHVPVFLKLDVPSTWNRSKVLKYLNEIKLYGTSDIDIRIMAISPDDLHMYSEIARRVLRDVDLLQAAINRIMSGLLFEAAIDTKKSADVVFSLTIPDITGECTLGNTEYKETHNQSPNNDGQERTKTEFDEKLQLDNYPLQLTTSLLRKINIKGNKGSKIIDCVIIGELVVFVDATTKRLIIHQTNGMYKQDINLSGDPRSITVLDDKDVAVLYNKSIIEIISTYTGQVQHEIKTRNDSTSISYQNGELFIDFSDNFVIDVMNLNAETIRSFSYQPSYAYSSLSLHCLSNDTDRLFLTGAYILVCCDIHGSVKWEFSNDKMKFLEGVMTDSIGNVYVSCFGNKNVIVISPDGNHYKELLTMKDGLVNPRGIYYDKSSNCLLVSNERHGDAFLFKVNQQ